MNNKRENFSLMVKPTHDCNMNCEYCFVSKLTREDRETKMPLEMVNKLYELLNKFTKRAEIIWHGGEPTLMGPDWYKNVIELSKYYSQEIEITHSMQSNGTLFMSNPEWINLMENLGLDVGISYDGLNQEGRKEGTTEIVEDNLEYLKNNNLNIGTINVYTKESLTNIILNYEKSKEKKVLTSFNYVINGEYGEHENFQDISIEENREYYHPYLEHWLNDIDGYPERSAITDFQLALGIQPRTCSFSDCRHKWIDVDPTGLITPCNRYFPEEYHCGNIMDIDSIEEVWKSEGHQRYSQDIEERLDNYCKDCEIYSLCNGGCNSMHMMNTGSIKEVYEPFCDKLKDNLKFVTELIIDINIEDLDKYNPHFKEIINQAVLPTELFNYLEEEEIEYGNKVDTYMKFRRYLNDNYLSLENSSIIEENKRTQFLNNVFQEGFIGEIEND